MKKNWMCEVFPKHTLSHHLQLSHQQFHVVSHHSVPDTHSDDEISGMTCIQETLWYIRTTNVQYTHVTVTQGLYV